MSKATHAIASDCIEQTHQLVDKFGRQITYLRMSVTDRCDLRCVYCMPENMTFLPRDQLLSLEELSRIGSAFADLGVTKIRLTGGEPLTRRNIIELFKQLGGKKNVNDLTFTTNATQLSRYAKKLKQAGVTRINISLDTLDPIRFKQLTRLGILSKTIEGIDAAIAQGFKRIKLNAVILKNRNHDECCDLVQFAIERGIDISFIEEMPLGVIEDHDRAEAFYSSDDILGDLRQKFQLTENTATTGGPSKYYSIAGAASYVGFISPHSHNFCDDCNRVRLTAEGRLLLCLGQEHSVDLRKVVRDHPHDDAPLRQAIIDSMQIKPKGHDFMLDAQPVIFRYMNTTGG